MWINGLLVFILTVCTVTDIHRRKIYNAVIGPGLASAFVLHVTLGGWKAFAGSAAGFLAGLGLLLLPYLLGGMGAGDVKLLALVGALKGTAFVLEASMYMALAGGLMALLVVAFRRPARQRLWSLIFVLYGLRHGVSAPWPMPKADASGVSLPYGAAIAAGAFLCFLPEGWSTV